jgi:hypothetical protein
MLNEQWLRASWGMMQYTPNLAQAEIVRAVIQEQLRFVLICGGERAGKSITSVALALLFMDPTRAEGDFNYWIVGPDYAQARAEFDYFHRTFRDLGMVTKVSMPETKTQPWIMHIVYGDNWTATIETRTSSDITKLATFSVHGVLMVEAAQQTNDVWLKLRGRVAETRGWVVLSGTLENGLPWYSDMLDRWEAPNDEWGKSFSVPTWTNTAIFPGGEQDPEILALKRVYPPDLFNERFGAKPRKKRGLVIPEFIYKKNVKALEFDPQVPVELFIDPAQHTYAVWFAQRQGQYCHILDAVYEHGLTVFQIVPLCKKSKYWKYVKTGVIDVAGTQQHANKSQLQLWRELGNIVLRFRKWPLNVLINTTRARIGGYANGDVNWEDENLDLVPLVFFDKHFKTLQTPDGLALEPISEFSLWKWPDRKQGSDVPTEPIDRNNDAIKALGYGLLDWYGPFTKKVGKTVAKKRGYWV